MARADRIWDAMRRKRELEAYWVTPYCTACAERCEAVPQNEPADIDDVEWLSGCCDSDVVECHVQWPEQEDKNDER